MVSKVDIRSGVNHRILPLAVLLVAHQHLSPVQT